MPIPAVVMAVGAGVAALAAWAFSQSPDRPGDHKKVKKDDAKELPAHEVWCAGGTLGICEEKGDDAKEAAFLWVKKHGPPIRGIIVKRLPPAQGVPITKEYLEEGQQTWGVYGGEKTDSLVRVFYVWKEEVKAKTDDKPAVADKRLEELSAEVAKALAANDIPRLEALAKQADKEGLHDIAVSIRAEVAILKGQAVTPADDDAKKKAALAAAKKKAEDDAKAAAAHAADVQKAKDDEVKRLAAKIAAEHDEDKKRALIAAQKKAEDDARAAAAAKRKAEDDARLAAAAKKKAEDDARAAAKKAADDEKKKTANQPVESDSRVAAREVTDYLTSLGGLAARYKEDKPRMVAWLSRIGAPDPKGMYGRAAAAAVMQQGFVPVVPLYWPSGPAQGWASAAAKAKSEFRALVNQYKAADLPRAAQWDALLANVTRS